MPDVLMKRAGVPVLVCGHDGASIATAQDALDVIVSSFSRADIVAIPAGRLDERFFDLRTGLAGDIMQKFVNYQVRLVIVGDISAHLDANRALRGLVYESNHGNHVWFVADLSELDERIGRLGLATEPTTDLLR